MNTQELKFLRDTAEHDEDCGAVMKVDPTAILCLINKISATERERDELRAGHAEAAKVISTWYNRAKAAEAELARRDAAAGEPVAWQFYDDGSWHNGSNHNNHRENTEKAGYRIRELCVMGAQPALLPPEVGEMDMLIRRLVRCVKEFSPDNNLAKQAADYMQRSGMWKGGDALREDAIELSGQPQNPVVCPSTNCIGSVKEAIQEHDAKWVAALDAAGVKWEVKK